MIVHILWYVTQSWEVMPLWDLPWLPKCRFKQLLIRKGRKWRNQDQSRNSSVQLLSVSNSFQPHGLQHASLLCPLPISGASSILRPLSPWCHPTISSSSPSPPAFNLSQHQGLFQWVSSSHQVAKVLEFVSTSVLPWNTQDWSPLGWTGWISLQCKTLFKSLLQHHSSKASILWKQQCLILILYSSSLILL